MYQARTGPVKYAKQIRNIGNPCMRCQQTKRKERFRLRGRHALSGVLVLGLTAMLWGTFPSLSTSATSETQAALEAAQEAVSQTEDAIESNQDALDTLEETQETLTEQLDTLSSELATITSSLASLRAQISDKESEIAEQQAQIEEMEALLEETQAALEAAQEEQASQYAAMKKRIQFMYEKGNFYYIEILLSSRSFGDLLNYQQYIQELSRYDQELLEEYTALAEEIAAAKEELEEQQAQLEAEQAELLAEQEELSGLESSASEQASQVNSLVSQTAASIDVADAQISTAEEIAEILEEQLETQNETVSALQAQLEEEQRLQALSDASEWRDISQVTFSDSDRYLLANLIYCEAGGESYEGQLAVGAVVMNRVLSGAFPNTISEVIYQSNQFAPVSSGRLALALANDYATDSCYQAADAAMAGQTNVSTCLFFRTPIDEVTPKYTIGGHIFY